MFRSRSSSCCEISLAMALAARLRLNLLRLLFFGTAFLRLISTAVFPRSAIIICRTSSPQGHPKTIATRDGVAKSCAPVDGRRLCLGLAQHTQMGRACPKENPQIIPLDLRGLWFDKRPP